jgi:hypothetical protein
MHPELKLAVVFLAEDIAYDGNNHKDAPAEKSME